VSRAAPGERPELGGLYCGFAPIKAKRGVILSLIAIPTIDEAAFVTLVDDVLALLDETEDFGHPLRKKGPLPAWAGGGIEGAIASTEGRFGPLARPHVVIRAVTSRLLLAAGIPLRGFHPAHYRRQLVDNRAVEDGSSRRQAAERLGVSVSFVVKLLQRWQARRSVAPDQALGARTVPARLGPDAKKTARAAEQVREDVAKARAAWLE
jgi:hypothetical protein